MLPITNHRAFQIPHSLATVAAIVALVTAVGWNASGSESIGSAVESGALDQFTSTAPQDAPPPAETPGPTRTGGADCEPGVLSGLLPLVLPSISGF